MSTLGAFIFSCFFLIPTYCIDVIICNSILQWCIKHRWRRPVIFYAPQLNLQQLLDNARSLDEFAFICEAISHIDVSTNPWAKKQIEDKLYQCIHTDNPLYVKYLVEVLMAYGWDINSKFNMIYERGKIKELTRGNGLLSTWFLPDPALWKARKISSGASYSDYAEYQCIATLAALLKANLRYDALYLLLMSFPQFEKSCAPLFNIKPADLPERFLISAYVAYKLSD